MKIGAVLCRGFRGLLHLILSPFKKPISLPTLGSSFIQYWYCQEWDIDRWIEELKMLQKIGISEIILQNIVDTKARYAAYPTQMKGYSCNSRDMVDQALLTAESLGMKVRIGLGFNEDWWSFDTHDRAWLEKEAEVNQVIVTEILMRYGEYSSFSGWYIPHEFNPLMALTHDQHVNLNQFFKTIATAIKSNSSLPIMIAPFYNAVLSGPVTLTLWIKSIQHVFKDTGVDILALQDSVGAGFNTLEDLDEIYDATQKACQEVGLKLYTIIETFEEKDGKYQPAPQARINKQLLKVLPYVEGFVAFSINHYQNGNDPEQVSGYEAYEQYFLKAVSTS